MCQVKSSIKYPAHASDRAAVVGFARLGCNLRLMLWVCMHTFRCQYYLRYTETSLALTAVTARPDSVMMCSQTAADCALVMTGIKNKK